MKSGTRVHVILVALGLALTGVACQPIKERRDQQDPIEEANRKIDQGRFDEAITDMEKVIQQRDSGRARNVLASAYAARAGLMIESHWAFLASFEAPTTPEITGRHTGRRLKGVAEIYSVITTIERWAERINALPVLDEAGRADVELALAVLAGSPEPGSRLYSALLGFVLIRSDLSAVDTRWGYIDNYIQDTLKSSEAAQTVVVNPCAQELRDFSSDAGTLLQRLQTIVEDLKVAYPSKTKNLNLGLAEMQKSSKAMLKFGRAKCE